MLQDISVVWFSTVLCIYNTVTSILYVNLRSDSWKWTSGVKVYTAVPQNICRLGSRTRC